MSFAKAMILLTFLGLFGAGVVCGLVGRRYVDAEVRPAGATTERGGGGSVLANQLQLSAEQLEKMKAIWSPLHEGSNARGEARRQLSQQRDAEIKALLTGETKEKYDAILQKYEALQARQREEGEAEMRAAEEKTREMLTPEQRKKYEEILARPRERERHRGGGGPGTNRGGPGSRP